MRRFKFRGKRIDNGEEVEGSLLYDDGLDKYFIVEKTFDLEPPVIPEKQFGVYAHEVDPETIEMIVEKDGKEFLDMIALFETIFKEEKS